MKRSFVFSISFLMISALHAQFTGLWQVDEVRVGDQVMTPVAKWFEFHQDYRLIGGNGGLRNLNGSYEQDIEAKTLLFHDAAETPDEYGPFTYKIGKDELVLKREEEGMPVSVFMSRTTEQPVAPWDQVVGRWRIMKQSEGTPQMNSISIRWDRRYALRTEAGQQAGVWHINAHAPVLRMLSDAGDDQDSQWELSFPAENQMRWQQKTDHGHQEVFLEKQ